MANEIEKNKKFGNVFLSKSYVENQIDHHRDLQ